VHGAVPAGCELMAAGHGAEVRRLRGHGITGGCRALGRRGRARPA
jgi:hypothetical protein